MATGDNTGLIKASAAGLDFNSLKGINLTPGAALGDAASFEQLPIKVRLAAVSAIPSYTYSNGTAGVGATLTATANGAMAAVDGLTPALNDLMLFPFGVSASDCGIFKLTQVGDGSNPFIWTRSTLADTSAKILGSTIIVVDGVQGKGVYQFATNAALTIGTDAIYYIRTSVDGLPTEVVVVGGDLISPLAPTTAATLQAEGFIALVSGAGATSATVASANSSTRIGQWRLGTGTATTGRAGYIAYNTSNDGASILLDTNSALFYMWKGNVATLSDGTNTYAVNVGMIGAVATDYALATPANGVFAQYDQSTDTHWKFVTANAGSATKTTSGSSVTAGTDDVIVIIKNAGSDVCQCWINQVQVGTGQSTNVPKTNPTAASVNILKSAGTTTRTFDSDIILGRYYNIRRRAA